MIWAILSAAMAVAPNLGAATSCAQWLEVQLGPAALGPEGVAERRWLTSYVYPSGHSRIPRRWAGNEGVWVTSYCQRFPERSLKRAAGDFVVVMNSPNPGMLTSPE